MRLLSALSGFFKPGRGFPEDARAGRSSGRVLLLGLAIVVSVGLSAQQRLQGIRATSTGTGVLVEFSIRSGPACNGYSIWHSADSLAPFMQVLDNGGAVCGEQVGDEYFARVHTTPVQERTNYYRVQIDFPYERSAIYPVYVSAQGRSGITVYPNPVPSDDRVLKARLSSGINTQLTGTLHDRFGVRKQGITVDAIEGSFSIPLFGMDHGVYLLWLTDGTNVYSTKVILSP